MLQQTSPWTNQIRSEGDSHFDAHKWYQSHSTPSNNNECECDKAQSWRPAPSTHYFVSRIQIELFNNCNRQPSSISCTRDWASRADKMLSNYICINSSMQTQLGHMEDVRCLMCVLRANVRWSWRQFRLSFCKAQWQPTPIAFPNSCGRQSCHPLSQSSSASMSRRRQ